MATPSQIREHYDSLAFVYRTYWGDHIHHGLFQAGTETPAEAQEQLIERCVELVGLRGGESVFDVGCGHGGTSIYLAQHYRCRVLGLTLSEKQSSLARQKAQKAGVDGRARFEVANADHYTFPTSTFDLVWNCESSEHFADKTQYFQNVAKTLKLGGKLLLAAWTGSMQLARVRDVARAFLCPELWTTTEYEAAISAAGLSIQHAEDLTARITRTWEICQQHARAAHAVSRLLPQAAREFVEGIDIILDAYQSGDLSYTILATAPKDSG
jgi:tocopherol O-methyltransferase